MLNLWGQIVARRRVPQRFTRGSHGCAKSLDLPNDIRAAAERVDPTDCENGAFQTSVSEHADPVAIKESAPLIGDLVCGSLQIQTAMNPLGELLKERQPGSLVAEFAQLTVPMILDHQLRHNFQKTQVTLLHFGAGRRTLKDFDHPRTIVVDFPWADEEQKPRRIQRFFFTKGRMGKHDSGRAGLQHRFGKPPMALLLLAILREVCFVPMDLVLRQQRTLCATVPKDSPNRSES